MAKREVDDGATVGRSWVNGMIVRVREGAGTNAVVEDVASINAATAMLATFVDGAIIPVYCLDYDYATLSFYKVWIVQVQADF